MRIEEICQKSGLSKESIYRFTRMGLLPRPSKIGFQDSLYSEEHLDRLNKIRELREKEKLSFSKIKTMLQVQEFAENGRQDYSQVKKEQIMDKALAIFSKNGFANTKVSDITDELGVAKGTFYLYFKSKKDLFVECMSRLTKIVLPEEVWYEISKEDDFVKRQRIKLTAFLKTFPTFSGVLSLLRMSLQNDDATVAAKARETYRTLEEPVRRDIKKAIEDGIARDANPDIVGVLLLGMAESLGCMLMVDPSYKMEEAADILLDFMANGLLVKDRPDVRTAARWHAKDVQGFEIILDDLRFGEAVDLPAALGEGRIAVVIKNIQSISVKGGSMETGDGTYLATLSHKDGSKMVVSVDGDLIVSGHSKLGVYNVPIKKLSELVASL